MKIIYESCKTIIAATYSFRIDAVTRALYSKRFQYLLLEAEVTSTNDALDLDSWLPPRETPVLITRLPTKFQAIRLAVEDAQSWEHHVLSLKSKIPPEWIPKPSQERPR